MTIHVSFIGCGRLGQAIAKCLHQSGKVTIAEIVTQSASSSAAAIDFIGAGKLCSRISDLKAADVIIIATPDDVIAASCDALANNPNLQSPYVLLHLSGALPSTILSSAKPLASIASVHPIKSVACAEIAANNFAGTYCAVEGDSEALPMIQTLFEPIGAKLFTLSADKKSLYHAALVMANNYLTTLHYHAAQALASVGLDETMRNQIVSSLMQEALDNLDNRPHQQALTGPIARGDHQTVANHLEALSHDSYLHSLYSKLGMGTLAISADAKIANLFSKENCDD